MHKKGDSMAYIKIHCADCGVVREIHKYMPEGADVRFCPLCGSELDADIWETLIIPAAEMLNKANREIVERHTTHSKPAFYVDLISDHLTQDNV